MLAFDNGLKLVQAANTIFNRGVGFSQALNAALAAAKINTAFPVSVLGQQLLTVAKVISIQSVLGINRQVFFCQLGGFDTHGTQIGNQDPLLQDLSQSVGAFYSCLSQELGSGQRCGDVHGFRVRPHAAAQYRTRARIMPGAIIIS